MSNMGTLAGANIEGQEANPQNELDFQVGNKMKKLARAIEKTFIQGTYNKATKDSEVNKTRGMNSAIVTNVISAESGSGASKKNAPLDIWLVNDLVQKMRDNGADISNLVLWVDTVNLNQLNGSAVENGVEMGKVRVALGEFLPSGTIFAFNFDVINPVEQPVPGKGNFFLEELAKTGAGEKYQLFGQIGLDYGNELFHGKITGLSTEFNKPEGRKVIVANADAIKPTVTAGN